MSGLLYKIFKITQTNKMSVQLTITVTVKSFDTATTSYEPDLMMPNHKAFFLFCFFVPLNLI